MTVTHPPFISPRSFAARLLLCTFKLLIKTLRVFNSFTFAYYGGELKKDKVLCFYFCEVLLCFKKNILLFHEHILQKLSHKGSYIMYYIHYICQC